ncbi:lysozyme family protein [Brytella acorum]|uniref:Uncharacterized protein n=1 Tax=Brytella acorum TaxID=2959299 RepID=A0AA35XXM3_9PROT|nr:hypothetical protein [Brytella acorum]CAI9120464.1 hypothetical protein LMG32879_001297 [Brytella acorum]
MSAGVAGPKTLAALRQETDGHYLALLFALASRQSLAYRSFSNFQRFGSGWIKRLEARLDAAIALAQGRVPAV